MMASDAELLADTLREAGEIAMQFWRNDAQVWDKDDGAGPVTEADLAVDAHLKTRIQAARPDYGWLSEETEDTTDRLRHSTVAIVDPIDGTRAFVAGEKNWAVSMAIVKDGKPVTAGVFMPAKDQLFTAQAGRGAFLDGHPIGATAAQELAGSTVLSARPNLEPRNWTGGTPPLERHFRSSLAYRLALVGKGAFDAMLTLRATWEWDVAAGHLIATEAGALVTDQRGGDARFNNPKPQIDGMVAAPAPLHARIIERLAHNARGA